jgi:hypothetical protein
LGGFGIGGGVGGRFGGGFDWDVGRGGPGFDGGLDAGLDGGFWALWDGCAAADCGNCCGVVTGCEGSGGAGGAYTYGVEALLRQMVTTAPRGARGGC